MTKNALLFFSHFILVMSKSNNQILDVTENFQSLISSDNINVEFLVVPGNYRPTSSGTIILKDSDISLEYKALAHLPSNTINWNKYSDSPDGITIIGLRNQSIPLNTLQDYEFIFFDVVSTFSIGTFAVNFQGNNYTIEICKAKFSDFPKVNRSTIIANFVNCNYNPYYLPASYLTNVTGLFNYGLYGPWTGNGTRPTLQDVVIPNGRKAYVFFENPYTKIVLDNNPQTGEGWYYVGPPTNFDGRSLNSYSRAPQRYYNLGTSSFNGFTICIDFNKQVPYPPCPPGTSKCWNERGVFTNGYCYNEKTNQMISTYCAPQYDNCFAPNKIGDVNTWFRQGGKACSTKPNNNIISQNNTSMSQLVGSGISNMREGTNKMLENAKNLQNRIVNVQELIEKQKFDMGTRRQQVSDTENLIKANQNVIKRKMNILDSRNKQLEQSIDRNIYWKKVLYVLFTIIIIIIVIVLFVTSFLKNRS